MSINLENGDKLQLILGAAVTVNVAVSFRDVTIGQAGEPVANQMFPQSMKWPGFTEVKALTTQATHDILLGADKMLGPYASREVTNIMITNKHATDPVTLTPQFYDNDAAAGFAIGCGAVTLQAQESLQWNDATGWIKPASSTAPELLKYLTADEALLNQNTVQQVFPTLGSVTVEGDTTYDMEGRYIFSTGATTRTTGLSFPSGASYTSLDYLALTFCTAALTIGPLSTAAVANVMRVTVNTNIVVNATSTAVETNIYLRGVVRVNVGGTFTPSFTWSADPTGACKILKNSFIRLIKKPGNKALASIGTWA